MPLLTRFRNFDVYTKPVDDYRVKTSFGGLITLVSFIVILILFFVEAMSFLSVEVVELLFVDSTSSEQRVDINFDIALHNLPCDFVTVDVMGASGEVRDSVEDDIYKKRLDSSGNEIEGSVAEKQIINANGTTPSPSATNSSEDKLICGSCYGAIRGCCNTCEEVKEAYRFRGWQIEDPSEIEQCKNDLWAKKLSETRGQGCRLYGKINIGKVGGNFHIAPGESSTHQHTHVHDFHSLSVRNFDTSHTINHLSFGKSFPGKVYPMDGKKFDSSKPGFMHQYNLKVVPTEYVYKITKDGLAEESHQFSVTRNERDILEGANGIPGLFFQYEFSALMVRYEERKKSLSHFLVSLCAIIGGVYTVASLVDSFIYSGARAFQRKLLTGKFT